MRSEKMTDYHWSPANQRGFLEAFAESGNVEASAKAVSMSPQSAYRFCSRDAGRVFKMGWDAAVLIARRRVEGEMLQRALVGQQEIYERDPESGKVTRTRIHNGTTMAMLKRLDQMAWGKDNSHADIAIAQIVAQDFERFLDLVEAGGSGAEAILFLKARDGGLVPMASIPGLIEAAEFAKQPNLSQKSEGFQDEEAEFTSEAEAANMTIWYCEYADGWRTNFPPPEDFIGEEDGEFGCEGYARELDDEEEICRLRIAEEETAPLRVAGEAARRAWFGIVETKACGKQSLQIADMPTGSAALEAADELQNKTVPIGTVLEELHALPEPIPSVAPEILTHRPVYMNPPSRYLAAGQIPPWAERIG
jgi:hypothetical protein